MFGYVKAAKPDLRVREYEAYKGVYCTLCKTLGKRYGIMILFFLLLSVFPVKMTEE